MASNSDTMIEGLKSLVTSIAQLKLLPDADPQFLGNLEGQVITYVKAAGQQQINGSLGPAQAGGMANPGGPGDATMAMSSMGPNDMGGAGGMPMPPGMQIAPGGGAGMSGLAPQQPPNADELRRIMQGPTG